MSSRDAMHDTEPEALTSGKPDHRSEQSLALEIRLRLLDVSHRMRTAIDNQLAALALSRARYQVLAVLEDSGATYIRLLAHRCGVTPSPMLRLLQGMVEAQLVRLAPRARHGQTRVVELCPFGKGLLRHAHDWMESLDRQLLTHLSHAEREELARLLERCSRGLRPVRTPDPE